MCQYWFTHHHHIPPCPRPSVWDVQYEYCEEAHQVETTRENLVSLERATASALDQLRERAQPSIDMSDLSALSEVITVLLPCSKSEHDPNRGSLMDAADPCERGTCEKSKDCAGGACRLEDVGYMWKCCKCAGMGNEWPRCTSKLSHMKPFKGSGEEDRYCCHLICQKCSPDKETLKGETDSGVAKLDWLFG